MTRRQLFALGFGTAIDLTAQRYRTYADILPEYLARLVADAYRRRNAELAKLTTPDAIRARQRWVTETFWRLAGGMPERTPLNIRTTGMYERQGYRVEKLCYESQQGVWVPANLYIPTAGKPPFPGVLFQMGHSRNGKAAVPYQKCCQGLARLGYLVLAFDPMGQGERIAYPDMDSADQEHTYPGLQMLLTGDTATRLQTWDAVRSLDVLAAHPMVDKARLASTGQSGGGTLTMFLAACDDRLACAAVSSGNTENVACAGFIPPGSVDDAEQDFIASAPAGFDRWDTLYPLAPKPLLVTVSAKDFFGTYSHNYMKNGREEFDKLKRVYATLGREANLEWAETPVPHALSHDVRLRIYDFFERTLRGRKGPAEEPPVQPEPDAVLTVGLPKWSTPQQLAVQRLASLQPSGKVPWTLPVLAGNLSIVGTARGERCDIRALEVQSESGVWLPGWSFVPNAAVKAHLLVFDPAGRNARWREDDLYHQLASQGIAVYAFDVRGIGDARPPAGRNGNEDGYALGSLILGRSLLEQRIADMTAIARALTRTAGKLRLAAKGHLAIPALFTAAAERSFSSVYLSGAPESYASIVRSERYAEPLSSFAPRILAHTDLPQLRASLGGVLREGKSWDRETLGAI